MNDWVDKNCAIFEQQAKEIAENMRKEAAQELQNKFLSIVRMFYIEYIPKYYVRHYDPVNNWIKDVSKKRNDRKMNVRGGGVGMLKTMMFVNDNRQSGIKTYYLKWSTKYMYNDYSKKNPNKTKEYVLQSFEDGWHGPPNVVPHKKTFPNAEIVKCRDSLVKDFTQRCSVK